MPAVKVHFADRVKALGACEKAVAWLRKQKSPLAAWLACNGPEWMLWLLGKLDDSPANSPSRRSYVTIACECARLTLENFERAFPGDKRPREAIELCERYAAGADVSFDELKSAADSARMAAASARMAAASARMAANSARMAADSAWMAVDSARMAAASAWMAIRSQACEIIRRHFPKPPRIKETHDHA